MTTEHHPNCIFCKMVAGEIKPDIVFENDQLLAFRDINPQAPIHFLIIPKKHFSDIFEIEEDYLNRIILVAKKIAKKMKDSFGADGVNLYQASGACAEQSVFHFHLHVIPRREDDGLCFNHVITNKDISTDEFKEIVTKLKIEE